MSSSKQIMRFTVEHSRRPRASSDIPDQIGVHLVADEAPSSARRSSAGPRLSMCDADDSEQQRRRPQQPNEQSMELVSVNSRGQLDQPSAMRLDSGPSGGGNEDDDEEEEEEEPKEMKRLLVVKSLANRGQLFANRQTARLVHKDGSCNVSKRNITNSKRKYLVDIFTTLVDMRWRYNLLMFTAAFVFSWLIFGTIWFVIAYIHGDHEHLEDDDWKPCAGNVYDFPTALLFSIETQTTIGYGFRYVTQQCTISFFVLIIQSCFGVFMQSLLTGLVFSKMSRPKRRAHTIMFSNKAVITKRDYEYCLLFRVGDMRKSHFIGTSIRAFVVKDRLTKEGETIPLCKHSLDLETETCTSDSFVFLVWPVTVVHKINSSSPLWDISAEHLLSQHFEIIVILEGVVESTGGTTQLRTSYLPSEILWGHRPVPLMTFQKENGQYKIDYTQFHAVEPMLHMPDCSAKTLAEQRRRSGTNVEDEPENEESFSAYFTVGDSSKSRSHRRVFGRVRNSIRKRKQQRSSVASDGGELVDDGRGQRRSGSVGVSWKADQSAEKSENIGNGRGLKIAEKTEDGIAKSNNNNNNNNNCDDKLCRSISVT